MLAPGHQQPLLRRLAQPEAKWHGAAREVIRQPAIRLELGLLHHVGRVDPELYFGPEPRRDNLPQVRPVPLEEPLEGLPVAGLRLLEQAASLVRVGCDVGHDGLLSNYLHARAKMDRQKREEMWNSRKHHRSKGFCVNSTEERAIRGCRHAAKRIDGTESFEGLSGMSWPNSLRWATGSLACLRAELLS